MQWTIFFISALVSSLFFTSGTASADAVNDEVAALVARWDEITFQMQEVDREEAYEKLAARANELSKRYANRAEPLVWEGIILSTYAGAKGGLGALSLIKKSRDCLLKAEGIDASAEEGSIYTTLGTLYYQAPSWPISFGDNEKAEKYFRTALKINPRGIDANYFYGDFLRRQGQDAEAERAFKRALAAPPRPERTLADRGRKYAITEALRELSSKR